MSLKKTVSTLIIASSAFLAYNNISSAETQMPAVPATATIEEIETTTVEKAKEVSPFDNAIKTTTTTTTTTVDKIDIEDIQPAIIMELKPEIKEIIKEEKTTVKTEPKANNTLVEVQKTTTETIKVEEDKIVDTIVEETKVEETTTATTEVKNEVKTEELPVLDEIELPALIKKPVNNEPVKIEVSSQRIPIGTVVPLKLESPINSISSAIGDQFNASLTSDIIVGDNIVLPAGSIVRGTVGKMQKAGMFVKEAKILLVFDHVVTPAGKQIPIYAYMTGNSRINYEGFIIGGTSFGKEFKKDAAKSKDILINTTTYGVDKGLEYLGGVPVVLTAPLCAIGGTLGSGGYLLGKSVYNMFQRGGEVLLEPGTKMNITLSKSLDIPVN